MEFTREPNDFYRFTKYGLRYLCEKTGLQVLDYKSLGSFWGRVGLKISYRLERLVLSKRLIISFIGKAFRLVNNIIFYYIQKKWPTPKDTTGNLIVAKKEG